LSLTFSNGGEATGKHNCVFRKGGMWGTHHKPADILHLRLVVVTKPCWIAQGNLLNILLITSMGKESGKE